MTMSGRLIISSLIVLLIACPLYQQSLNEKRLALLAETTKGYIIPSKFSGPASLEFKGIVSDFLYLKISTFIGGKIVNKEMMDSTYADYFYNAAQIVTDLDPWFWDAYLMNSMILAWDFNRVDLAIKLLEKATEYRSWDFKPPYYLGFKYYYFKKDNDAAAEFFFEAVKRGGAPKFLLPLAARLSVYQNKLTPAILILEEQLKTTHDPVLAKQLRTRLEVLIKLDFLEKKVAEFKKTHGRFPDTLKDLVAENLIKTIPEDPYGGTFFITDNKRVFTTSEMRFVKK